MGVPQEWLSHPFESAPLLQGGAASPPGTLPSAAPLLAASPALLVPVEPGRCPQVASLQLSHFEVLSYPDTGLTILIEVRPASANNDQSFLRQSPGRKGLDVPSGDSRPPSESAFLLPRVASNRLGTSAYYPEAHLSAFRAVPRWIGRPPADLPCQRVPVSLAYLDII